MNYQKVKESWAFKRFFGMIRSAGGCNTDPDPILFAQTFRLLSAYSLVKPPRGSNIGTGAILKSLLNAKDVNHNEPQSDILETWMPYLMLDIIWTKSTMRAIY